MTRLGRFAAALLAVLIAVPAFAQGTTGTLTGSVTDDQGLALPGANVTVTNLSTGFTRSATTDATGTYRIAGLPFGNYEAKSELTGFAVQSRKDIAVSVAATT